VDVDHMIGANMSLRLQAIRDAGGIRDYYPGSCLREETDISLRVRRIGGRIVYEPRAVVRHVAGTYAKGRRFDARYRFYGARNHVVLLATVFGWRHTLPWRFMRTAAMTAVWDVRAGLKSSARLAVARAPLPKAIRAAVGPLWRSGVDLIGLVTGVACSFQPRDRARLVAARRDS
jgi:GT2 family glycosyltransferase